jgi:hypothetical protein
MMMIMMMIMNETPLLVSWRAYADCFYLFEENDSGWGWVKSPARVA